MAKVKKKLLLPCVESFHEPSGAASDRALVKFIYLHDIKSFSLLSSQSSSLTSHLSPTTPILFQALVNIVASSQALYHTLH